MCCRYSTMADSIMSKAATMEIPINSNGDTGTPEDDSLEQVSHVFTLTCPFVMCWHVLNWVAVSFYGLQYSLDWGCSGQLLPNHAQASSYLH